MCTLLPSSKIDLQGGRRGTCYRTGVAGTIIEVLRYLLAIQVYGGYVVFRPNALGPLKRFLFGLLKARRHRPYECTRYRISGRTSNRRTYEGQGEIAVLDWRRRALCYYEHSRVNVITDLSLPVTWLESRVGSLLAINHPGQTVAAMLSVSFAPYLRRIRASCGGIVHLCNPPAMFIHSLCESSPSAIKSPSFSITSRRHVGISSCRPSILNARI